MGVSPAYFREQGCCDEVRHGPVWETRGGQLYRAAGTMALKQEEDGFSGAEGLLRWLNGRWDRRVGGQESPEHTGRCLWARQACSLPLSPTPDT